MNTASAAAESTVVTDPRAGSEGDAATGEKSEAQICNELIRDGISSAESAGKFADFELCHNTKIMWTEGQTKDGRLPKLHLLPKERKVFSWEGAPDTRVPYADEVLEEHQLIMDSVWHRGEIQLGPRETEDDDGQGDEDKAGSWQAALNLWLDVSGESISYEQSLFNMCRGEYGYAGVFVGARRVIRTAKRTVSLRQLLALLTNQATEAVMAAVNGQPSTGSAGSMNSSEMPAITPQMAMDIQAKAQDTLELLLTPDGEESLRALLLQFDAAMPKTEARFVARELRALAVKGGEVQATYYAPQDDGYWPVTRALMPFINWIHGSDLTGAGATWWHGLPEILCEADLRARAAAEGWDAEFTDRVLQHPNQYIIDDLTWAGRVPRWACTGQGVGQVLDVANTKENFYQVAYMHRQLVNEAGEPMVYHTLVHPKINDLVGFHECSGLEMLPVYVKTREKVLYAMQSRGIPQIVVAGQNEIKDLMDAEGARGQLGSNPPMNRSSKGHVPIEPGKQLFTDRNETNAFLAVPTADTGTMVMMDRVRDMLDRRFFRNEKVDPDMKRLFREALALDAAASIRAVVRLIWKVMQGKVDTLRVGRIAGRRVDIELDRDSMAGDVDVTVEMNVDGLSVEASDKTIDWATKLMQLGADNVDVNELANLVARTKNPNLARRIIIAADVAADRIRNDQRNRIAQLWSGSPLPYPDRQTNPRMRFEEMTAWEQDPENLIKLQQSPQFMKRMLDEKMYLSRQFQQYTQNAQTGRSLMPEGGQKAAA